MAKIPTGRFVWFEYQSPDPRKAQAFFGELFGWKTKEVAAGDNPYTMIAIGDDTIGGYWPPPPAGAPQTAQWISHLQVEDAAQSAAKVVELGGKVMMDPMQAGDFGTFALVQDPRGALFSLWQPASAKGEGDFRGKPGFWVWNELVTDDQDKATAFYAALGGFEVDKMDMGQHGAYHVLRKDGAGRAGITKIDVPNMSPHWVPYVQVDDPDQIAERATRLGAMVPVPPTDIPGVGRFAVVVDPQGASLGILKPAPR